MWALASGGLVICWSLVRVQLASPLKSGAARANFRQRFSTRMFADMGYDSLVIDRPMEEVQQKLYASASEERPRQNHLIPLRPALRVSVHFTALPILLVVHILRIANLEGEVE